MDFEDYVKEELKKISSKVDDNSNKIHSLMVFMAVKEAEDKKRSKYTSGLISLVVSLIVLGATKFLGG